MKADRIEITPLAYTKITYCEIKKAVNAHGEAVVKGYIEPEKEQEYLSRACRQTEISIEAIDEDGTRKVIYCGILKDLVIQHKNSVCEMELSAAPFTYLLDLNPVKRSFQIPSMTYQEVFGCVLGGYAGGNVLMNTGASAAIGEPIVQYQETDWEFALRLASHFHTVIIPSYVTSGPKLYLGLSGQGRGIQIAPVCYRAKKAVSEYLYKEQNQVNGIAEDDSLWYIVEDQELYEIGEEVVFQGKTYYIAQSDAKLDGHQLWNTYQLRTQNGFKVPKLYNERVIGASLDGKITAVNADVVRASLGTDAKSGEGKWFSFSTVYSSPDGSGWYCMPEPGDEIRLYFPTEKEKHAYVISAVHLPVAEPDAGETGKSSNGGGSSKAVGGNQIQTAGTGKAGGNKSPVAKRSDPDYKTIRTTSGKMVELSPQGIVLDSGDGMRVELSDKKGISIVSHLGVTIETPELVNISSLEGKVEIMGAEGVDLKQGTGKIEVASDNVVFYGANSKVQ